MKRVLGRASGRSALLWWRLTSHAVILMDGPMCTGCFAMRFQVPFQGMMREPLR